MQIIKKVLQLKLLPAKVNVLGIIIILFSLCTLISVGNSLFFLSHLLFALFKRGTFIDSLLLLFIEEWPGAIFLFHMAFFKKANFPSYMRLLCCHFRIQNIKFRIWIGHTFWIWQDPDPTGSESATLMYCNVSKCSS